MIQKIRRRPRLMLPNAIGRLILKAAMTTSQRVIEFAVESSLLCMFILFLVGVYLAPNPVNTVRMVLYQISRSSQSEKCLM